MKKNLLKSIIILAIVIFIITICAIYQYKNVQAHKKDISQFNQFYEDYNRDNLNGLDITSVINRAVNNNEKYEIPKDENGYYILDDENSIEIYITMIINNTTYKMERINQIGMEAFIEYFGVVGFKCTDIQYHEKSGKISYLTFEATEY